jgi:gamma-glutamylcyclotransferase (GGCT)/AIG2-like uncharacterized protein YtfP
LYHLRDAGATLAALDAYEGSEFERAVIEVDGEQAWIYMLRQLPEGAERIASGEFRG